jgi:hypothetical protein
MPAWEREFRMVSMFGPDCEQALKAFDPERYAQYLAYIAKERRGLDPDEQAQLVASPEFGISEKEKELIETLRRLYKERKPRKAGKGTKAGKLK